MSKPKFKFSPLLAVFPLTDTERALAAMIGVQLCEACQNLQTQSAKDTPANRASVQTSMAGVLGAVALLNGTASRAPSPGLNNVSQRATATLNCLKAIVDSRFK